MWNQLTNLAGRADCDKVITEELSRAGIAVLNWEGQPHPEVPYTKVGYLLNPRISFHRARTYWVAKGPVPLPVAEFLYRDPVGKTDIRVNGHAGCPAPEGLQVNWRTDEGVRILSMADKAECEKYAATESAMKKIADDLLESCLFSDFPWQLGGKGYVDLYHIDSEVGLRVFADTLTRDG